MMNIEDERRAWCCRVCHNNALARGRLNCRIRRKVSNQPLSVGDFGPRMSGTATGSRRSGDQRMYVRDSELKWLKKADEGPKVEVDVLKAFLVHYGGERATLCP